MVAEDSEGEVTVEGATVEVDSVVVVAEDWVAEDSVVVVDWVVEDSVEVD